MIINNVKFLGSRIMPNPIEVDYWVDTRSDPYGSVIKYHNGTDWVLLNTGGNDVDLSNYYTKEQVDSRISGKADVLYVNTQVNTIGSTKADKTSVYTKGEVDSMFLNFDAFDESKYYTKLDIDGKGYLTTVPTIYITEDELTTTLEQYPSFAYVYSKAEVDKKITDIITGGTVDLSNYYTKPEVDKLIPKDYLTSIPAEYVTETELNAKGYLTTIPSEFVTESELNAKGYLQIVPSEYVTESELNAKGYLTEHLSLANYYNKSEVNNLIDNIEIPDPDLSNYYNKDEVDASLLLKANADNVYDKATVDKKITDAITGGTVDLSNYYNKTEVDQLIDNIDIPEINLSDYYTKSEVTSLIPDVSEFITEEDLPTVPTKVSELTNDKGYITLLEVPTVPNEVAVSNGEEPIDDTEVWIDLSEDSIVPINDAPSDDKLYGRKNGSWIETTLTFIDMVASNWVESATYPDYSYSCDLHCEGVLNTNYAEVIFNLTEATSGLYAPICETDVDVVRIYGNSLDTITIPTILITR